MNIGQKILSEDEIGRLISVARQIHDASPSDARTGDKWPMAGLAMQYRMMEEQRAFEKQMLSQQGELVNGTWWAVRVALCAAVISILAVIATLKTGKLW